jgi:hypothetical protein
MKRKFLLAASLAALLAAPAFHAYAAEGDEEEKKPEQPNLILSEGEDEQKSEQPQLILSEGEDEQKSEQPNLILSEGEDEQKSEQPQFAA